jgi:hypothetical protein
MPEGYAASFRMQFMDRQDKDGSVGFAYYDQHCAAIIREEMGLPVPHAQQQAAQPRTQAVQWGTPVGVGTRRNPELATEPEPARAPAQNSGEAALTEELLKARAINAQAQALMADLAAKVASLTK